MGLKKFRIRKAYFILCAYTRQNCPHIIPDKVLKQMLPFYNLWESKSLSVEEVEEVKSLQRDDIVSFRLQKIGVNGTEIIFSLAVQLKETPCGISYLRCWIWAILPINIEYIAGLFYLIESHQNGAIRWFRWHRSLQDQTIGAYLTIVRDPKKLTKVSVDYYLDIQQIKYKKAPLESNFHLTPAPKNYVYYQWIIKNTKFEMKSDFGVLSLLRLPPRSSCFIKRLPCDPWTDKHFEPSASSGALDRRNKKELVLYGFCKENYPHFIATHVLRLLLSFLTWPPGSSSFIKSLPCDPWADKHFKPSAQ